MTDRLAMARMRLAESMEAFQANIDDLHGQMRSMNAGMKALDRNMSSVASSVSGLGDRHRQTAFLIHPQQN